MKANRKASGDFSCGGFNIKNYIALDGEGEDLLMSNEISTGSLPESAKCVVKVIGTALLMLGITAGCVGLLLFGVKDAFAEAAPVAQKVATSDEIDIDKIEDGDPQFNAWSTCSDEKRSKLSPKERQAKPLTLSDLCLEEQSYIRAVISHINNGDELTDRMKTYINTQVGGAVLFLELKKHIKNKVDTGRSKWERGEIVLADNEKPSGLVGDGHTFHPAMVLTPFELAFAMIADVIDRKEGNKHV